MLFIQLFSYSLSKAETVCRGTKQEHRRRWLESKHVDGCYCGLFEIMPPSSGRETLQIRQTLSRVAIGTFQDFSGRRCAFCFQDLKLTKIPLAQRKLKFVLVDEI